jgi:hypothetical protein
MITYLSPEQLQMQLQARRTVEQWLGVREQAGQRVLKWLDIESTRSGKYAVRVCEVFDDGSDDFVDVYDFSSLDSDKPDVVETFDDAAAALSFAETQGASPGRFVPSGKIQDVYKQLRGSWSNPA